jgi:nicotinamidase-related amidase
MSIALLLIEFQNEWLSPDGKLFSLIENQADLNAVTHRAESVLLSARELKLQVIHSGLSFNPGHPELGHASSGLRKHIADANTFVAGLSGAAFSKRFKPNDNEHVVQGRTGASAFSGSNLEAYCRHNQIHTLYVMGFALHVCVESTLRAAHDLGFNVVLIEDASAAFNRAQHDYVLQNVIKHFGEAISSNQFIQHTRTHA